MSRSRLLPAIAVVALLAGIGGLIVVRAFLVGDEVPNLTLASPTAPAGHALPAETPAFSSGTASTGAASMDPVSSTGPSDGTGTFIAPVDVAGNWAVADGSLVGYRVREKLGGVSALTDAVGRTGAISGSATLEASGQAVRVTAAAFEADLTQLASNDERRDNRIRSIGLESNLFPTASFVLGGALEVPASALTGATVEVTLAGQLTIHGVTKRVSIPGQARLNGTRIEVVGALTFPFSDFGMTPPDIAGFVQVEDDATLELLLSMAKA